MELAPNLASGELKLFQPNLDMSRFFLLFLALFLAISASSYAADNNIYSVDGVVVTASGKSPQDARNAAAATSRRDALLILLSRLEISTSTADNISNEEISDMVRSEQIDGERIAGNTYSATFNITFAKDFVNHILAKKNLKKPETKAAETYLLIPIKITKRETILWEENNDWKKAVEKNLSAKGQKKFIVPDNDLSNIAAINMSNVKMIDYIALEPMLLKYKADAAYVMFFSYDTIENKVNINVSYIRKLQKKQIKLGFVNVDRLSYEALLSKVTEKALNYLSSSQNSENKSAVASLVRIQIPITGLENWMLIKNKIENSNLINQLNIESISRDFVLISVNYTDPSTEITEAFALVNLNLVKKSENFYSLNPNN